MLKHSDLKHIVYGTLLVTPFPNLDILLLKVCILEALCFWLEIVILLHLVVREW